MRKVWVISIILLLVCGTLQAQKGFHVGVSAIFNSSWILNQNNFETLDQCSVIASSELAYTFTFGYNAGLSFGYNFNKKYGIQSGLLFNKAGQLYDDTFNPGAAACVNPYVVSRKVRLYYLQFPVYFKYKFDAGKHFRMYSLIGPIFAARVGATESVVINGVERTDLLSTDQKFNRFDWGVSLGVGSEYFFTSNLYLNFGLVTYFGVSDLNGPTIKEVEWFSKNDVSYQKSHNFRAGIHLGVNYLFGAGNTFGGKESTVIPGQTN